jgi:hypothetical protein
MLWIKTVVVRDEGAVGYVEMVWLRGYLPYGGPMAAWNPPLAYLIYLLPIQLLGNEIMPIRMINNVLFWASIVVLYLIAKDWYGSRVGLVSALFYGVFMNAPILETHLAIPGSLSIPFIIFSIYFCSIYLRKDQRSALLVSGLLMSSASLIVQYQATGIILLLVMLVHRYMASEKYTETKTHLTKDLMTDISILVVGVLLPFSLAFAYFWSYGVANDLIQAFSLARFEGYITSGDVCSSLKFLIIVEALPLWLFSLFGLIMSFLRFKTHDVLLIAWTLLFLPMAIVSPHFGRHFSQLVPVASLLSGVGIVPMLKLLPKNLRNHQRNASSIFFITVLVISFIPSVYFQPTQYPNTNFTLWNERLYYSFANNWNEQQEIVSFIKSNASGKAVLIHGWEMELYWLSGHLAPGIRWASSYKAPGIDITDTVYQEILNYVKKGDFEYVILMSSFLPDEIMRYVSMNYFFVKSIGLYQIYSKYNVEGYSIGYSFVENLGQAYQKYSLEDGTQGDLRDLNESIYLPVVEEISINGETRTVIKHISIAPWDSHVVDSNLIYSNISISPSSKLSFGIALHPDSWTKDTDGATFKILVQDDGGIHEMFSRHINPHENIEDRKWQDYIVELNEFAGKSVSIYFVTNPGPNRNNAYDWAYWSKPLLLESRT